MLASPNCHVGYALFWDTTQRRVLILHRYFSTTYRYSFKGQKIDKTEESKTEINWKIFCFGTLPTDFFKEACHLGSELSFLIGKRAPHLVDTQIELFSVTGHYRNSNLLRCATQDRSSPTVIPGKWKIKL